LCTKTFCEYEFYYNKDPNEKKNKDPDQESSDDDFEEEAEAKRKKKVFQTRVHEQKNQSPAWGYSYSHLLDIDDDIIAKLQSESITCAVYGMQDGREKFRKLNNTHGDKASSYPKKGGLGDDDEQIISKSKSG